MDTIQRDIELTAKLLRAELEGQSDDLTRAYDELFAQLEIYRAVLMKSSVPNGEKIMHKLSAAIEQTEIFLSYPQLLGKTLVGLVSFDEELFKSNLAPFISENLINRLQLDSGLPCLLLNQSEEIKALNDADNEIIIDADEYRRTNRKLYQYKLEIRKWLRAFSMRTEAQRHGNLAFVWLPLMYMDLRNEFNRNLMEKIDALIVFTPPELPSKQSERLKRVQMFFEKKSLYLVPESNVPEILHQLNFVRRNYLFVERLNLALLDAEEFYRTQLRDAESDMTQLKSDLINLNFSDTQEILSTLQNQTRRDKSTLESERFTLSKESKNLLEKAEAFEKLLASKMPKQDQLLFRTATLENFGELILRAVELENFNQANAYIGWLKQVGYAGAYIFELLTDAAQNRSSSFNRLEKLKHEPDDETIRKAKLKLRRRLNFSEFDCMQIARDIKRLSTAEEFYYRGRWLEHDGNINQAINFYKKATREGSNEASERLLNLSTARSDMNLLEWLAYQLVPAANYQLGVKARDEKKFGRSMTLFKLAAAHGYLPAIKELAKSFKIRVLGNYYKNISDAERKEKLLNCLKMHQYILQHESGNEEVSEATGDLYQRLGDERRAFNYWDNCSTATAYYKCGRLFQYPDGAFPQDLDRTEKYFERASNLGHEKASTELEKVRNWKRKQERDRQRQQERQIYSSQNDYSTRTETYQSSSSDDGFCVITTAVCRTLGKPDDCDELMSMRAYRDAAAERNPLVAALIEEYYRVAPLLIEKINRLENSSYEYKRLWNDFIVDTYRSIKAGDSRAATFKYIEMVTDLCRKYDVALADGIKEKIAALKLN